MNESLRRQESIYEHAVALPVETREAFLEQACGGDVMLRRTIDELLQSAREVGRFLESSPSLAPEVAAVRSAFSDQSGERIGRYRLIAKIGEGGAGVVYEAEQEEPVRRRVALKVIKPGMDTHSVIARFEAERQALALMDHPNIARVFDAGATESGRPYFVMELVRGTPITHYCDENRLPTEARLRLFIDVCSGVQHAHQKGVVHRDLKPSNILVTVHDGVLVPKIIDFGIAKATSGARLTDKTLVTQFHAFIGTPAYTSPEQIEMSGLDVDTRSDIYSLGVLLYELLAGRPPFDPEALARSGLEAMRRTIREVDPPRPSRRLATLSDIERISVAQQRSTEVAKLSLLLRGDVDWIVMHCLEKDRTRRYDTAGALATDIRSHLDQEPITARSPSRLYRTEKFIRRHRVSVAAGATIALLLVGGLVESSTLLVREQVAHNRAVVAEQKEGTLRREAEAARTAEAKRASRTSQALAEQFLQEGRTPEGLGHLVRAARSDPENFGVGSRLISALASRSFAEPIGGPLVHPTPLREARYFLDGRRCWTWAYDDALRIWNLESGNLEQVFQLPPAAWIGISPDDRRLALGGFDGIVSVWSLETGQHVLGPLRHGRQAHWPAFSPDGKWLGTASDDHTAKIWDAASGELKAVLAHDYPLTYLTFSPGSDRVLTTTLRGQWRIWRVPDGEPVTPFRRSDTRTNLGVFSPDGSLVLVPDNSGAQLFDATTGEHVGARLQHLGPCYYPRFSPDGAKVVTASDDSTARWWDVPSGQPVLPPMPHGGAVRRVRLTPDGRFLLTYCVEGMARVWDLRTGQLALEPIRTGTVKGVDLAPDGREFLTRDQAGTVRRWGIFPGAVTPFRLPPDPDRVGLSPGSGGATTAWVFHRDHMQKLDLLAGRMVGSPRPFPARITRAQLSPDERHLAVILSSGSGEFWNLHETEIARCPFPAHATATNVPIGRFSRDSAHFAFADTSNVVRVCDSQTGRLLIEPIEGASKHIDFSPDGRLVAIGMIADSVLIWDLSTGAHFGEPLRRRGPASAVRFSPDGVLLASGADEGFVQLWDVQTTRPIGSPLPHRTSPRGLAFTDDSQRLLAWTSMDARIWHVATGTPLTAPLPAGNNVQHAGFSADDTRIATCGHTGGELRLWDSMSGRLLADPIPGMSAPPVFFGSPGPGEFLAQTHPDGRLLVWPLPPQSKREPVPGWLLTLASTMAGGEIDAGAVFHEQEFDAKILDEIRRELAALPADAPYAEWGRWFLADRATRPIGPSFKITRAEMEDVAGQVASSARTALTSGHGTD